MVLRGAIAIAAASTFPLRRGYAGEAMGSAGEKMMLSDTAVADLQKSIKGPVILPSSPEYEMARRVWSPAIDRRPALIAKCTSVADIQATVQFARSNNILTAVRCGGHSYNGDSMADKGLVIDLTPLNGLEVDTAKKVAFVNGGAMLGELDSATVPHGLATTNGTVSHTGIGGLATGIGQGRLARRLGYTIDNIRGVEVVTPDGRLVRANAKENPDLYWAIRGGSGNFGIVTKFEMQLHEFDPNLATFGFTFPLAKAKDVMNLYFELSDKVPNDMSLSCGLATAENGETTVSLNGNHLGSLESAQKIIAAIDKLGEPLRKRFDTVEYVKVQSQGDGPLLSTRTLYMKSGFFSHVDSKLADVVVDRMTKAPMPRTSVRFGLQGGAANKIPSTATAFPYRDVLHQCASDGIWAEPKDGPALRKHADETWALLAPMTNGGFYVNYYVDPSDADIRRAFKGNYERLVEVKTKYDPTNFFHLNPNIKPRKA